MTQVVGALFVNASLIIFCSLLLTIQYSASKQLRNAQKHRENTKRITGYQ